MTVETPTLPPIETIKPAGVQNRLANQETLDEVNQAMTGKHDVVRLADYLKQTDAKVRGQADGQLNSHVEQFIIRDGSSIKVVSLADLQQQLAQAGLKTEILGLDSIGNTNQTVTAVVQGVNKDNPASAYERPVVAEGPHMILAPYAVDAKGQLHIFRTIQYRAGAAQIDTPRGFADAKTRENGEQLYEIATAGEKIQANLARIIKDEGGEKFLKIKRIVFLGDPRVNSSFVTSKSAVFGVEVDYDEFVKQNKVVSEDEYQRRREQIRHEGLTDIILDMNLREYVTYKRDPKIQRDMAADFGTDTVVIDFLANALEAANRKSHEQESKIAQLTYELQQIKGKVIEKPRTFWKRLVGNDDTPDHFEFPDAA